MIPLSNLLALALAPKTATKIDHPRRSMCRLSLVCNYPARADILHLCVVCFFMSYVGSADKIIVRVCENKVAQMQHMH